MYCTETAWDMLLQLGTATDEELKLITDINGYSLNTLEEVLYARTGYRSFEQAYGCDDDDDDENEDGDE